MAPRRLTAACALVLLLAAAALRSAAAHEGAEPLAVTGFLAIADQGIDVVVRLPLAALGDAAPEPRKDGTLDPQAAAPALAVAALAVARALVFAEGERTLLHRLAAMRLSRGDDGAFAGRDVAISSFARPALPADSVLLRAQAVLDLRLTFPAPSQLDGLRLKIAFPQSVAGRVRVALDAAGPWPGVRRFGTSGNAEVPVDPPLGAVALTFARLGAERLLLAQERLLLLLCLAVPLRRRPRALLATVMAFAGGQALLAVALGGATAGGATPTLAAAAAAAATLYVALENVVATRFDRRWLAAAAFGLLHGVGLGADLSEELQFAGAYATIATAAFVAGGWIAAAAVILLWVPLLNLAMARSPAERWVGYAIALVAAHQAWHLVLDRAAAIPLPSWPWP